MRWCSTPGAQDDHRPARARERLALTSERGWALEDGELDERRRSIGAVVRDHAVSPWRRSGSGAPAERASEPTCRAGGAVIGAGREITGALGVPRRAAPPRLEIRVIGAVEPPVPPVPRTDTPEGRPRQRQPAARRGEDRDGER